MRAVSRQSLLTHFWTIDGHALGPGDSARAESDARRSRTLGIFSNVLQVCFGDIGCRAVNCNLYSSVESLRDGYLRLGLGTVGLYLDDVVVHFCAELLLFT
jgi:hypothetical protein